MTNTWMPPASITRRSSPSHPGTYCTSSRYRVAPGLLPDHRGKAAGVFFEQPAEVGDGDAGKPLVLEQKQQLRFGGRAGVQPPGAVLSKERGLAAATHTDDGKRLAGDGGSRTSRRVKVRGWDGQGLVELGTQEGTGYCHFASDNIYNICPFVKVNPAIGPETDEFGPSLPIPS